jgi:hypothetical protein
MNAELKDTVALVTGGGGGARRVVRRDVRRQALTVTEIPALFRSGTKTCPA